VKLILEVDIREKRNKGEETNFFAERLKRAGLTVELSCLPIGDFLWTIEIEDVTGKITKCVTNYIIERKKADDLAASIVDGRYYD
jgi:ERCC4-type nuclease